MPADLAYRMLGAVILGKKTCEKVGFIRVGGCYYPVGLVNRCPFKLTEVSSVNTQSEDIPCLDYSLNLGLIAL